MLNLFDASLRIAASYGNIQQAKFTVWGSFTNNLYSTLESQIKDSLNKAGSSASSKLEDAQKKLSEFKNSFSSAQGAFQAGKRKVDDAKKSFDAANAKVAGLEHKVNSICSISNCGNSKDIEIHHCNKTMLLILGACAGVITVIILSMCVSLCQSIITKSAVQLMFTLKTNLHRILCGVSKCGFC